VHKVQQTFVMRKEMDSALCLCHDMKATTASWAIFRLRSASGILVLLFKTLVRNVVFLVIRHVVNFHE
jgi:hypothetical protein